MTTRQALRTVTEETDAQIIGRMPTDPARFATVFDRHYPAIHAYASRRLGPDRADDVAAETFLVAFDRWQRYDTNHSSARPWLFGIAANLIAGQQRNEARRYAALARADSTDPTGPAGGDHTDQLVGRLDAQAVRGRLARALSGIAPPDREVLLLVAWAGLSCEETARALEIPAGTARSRLHRARTALLTRIDARAGTVRVPSRPRPRRAWGWRVGLATGVAAAVAAGLLLGLPGGSGEVIDEATADPVGAPLELAAAYAAARPFTDPAPDQWAYVELSIATADAPSPTLRRSWYRIDGTQIAIPDGTGNIDITTNP